MNFLSASVDIEVDDSRLKPQLAAAKSAVTRTVDRIRSTFGRMATSFKAAFDKIVRYAKYGALIVAGALALMTRAAMKQEDVMAKLAITLKSTGYAARLTATQLIEQAKALQKITVYGDEAIIELQTLLLTFKAIGGETFQRATLAILDMSTAMGQDLKQGAIQVGKALNDPILGVTALRRVGVQLTQQQEKMIRTFVEMNQIAKAQEIILRELESQFGGMSQAVETASGKWAQMKNALGDVYERIGDALLPAFKDTTTAIKQWAIDNEEKIAYWAKVSVAYIAYVKDMLWSFVKFMQTDWEAGLEYAMKVGLILVREFANQTVQAFKKLAVDIENVIVDSIGPAMTRGWTKAVEALRQSKVGRFIRWPFLKLEELTGLGKEPIPGPPTKEELIRQGYLSEKTAVPFRHRLKAIVPPELAADFNEAAEKLKASLKAIGTTAKQTEELMEGALVEPFEKAEIAARDWSVATSGRIKEMLHALDVEYNMLGKISHERKRALSVARFRTELEKEFGKELERTAEQQARVNELMGEYAEKLDKIAEGRRGVEAFTIKLKEWGRDATNVWENLGEVATRALDSTSDALANMVLRGKADFKSLAQSIIMDLTRMIIKAMLFRIIMAFFGMPTGMPIPIGGGAPAPVTAGLPGTFGYPTSQVPMLQGGGTVQKTGFAMVHKGETYSGVGGNNMEVHIHNEGSEKLEITEAQEYLVGNQRILDVTLQAMQTNLQYRRGISQVRR